MALDKTHKRVEFRKVDIEPVLKSVEKDGWSSLEVNGVQMTLVRFQGGPHLFGSCERINRSRLEEEGFFLIPGAPVSGQITLQGGSVCSTTLVLNGQGLVRKTVKRSELEDVDTIKRHRDEANWLSLDKVSSSGLFPEVYCVEEGDHSFFYDSQFFPAYSLGELMFRGEISVHEVKTVVRRIISACSAHLHSTPAENAQENYLKKASRRYQLLVSKFIDPIFFSELMNNGAVLQGVVCRSLGELFNVVAASRQLSSIINCSDARLCHGDLIPEDILFSRRANAFKLIDPNPQIRDPLADFGKMQMSFELGYDLAYRDLIQVEHFVHRGKTDVRFDFARTHAQYFEAQTTLAGWFPELVNEFKPTNASEAARYSPESVRLMAAFQALSLPVFHALQHNKVDRAKYFFAKGHLMLETSLRRMGF